MSPRIDNKHEADAAQARRDLERLHQQSEKLTSTGPDDGIDPNDPIEKWGRIIGRSLGYVFAAGLLYHLVTTYL